MDFGMDFATIFAWFSNALLFVCNTFFTVYKKPDPTNYTRIFEWIEGRRVWTCCARLRKNCEKRDENGPPYSMISWLFFHPKMCPKIPRKPTKNWWKNHLKNRCVPWWIFSSILSSETPPKWLQNPSKNRKKKRSKKERPIVHRRPLINPLRAPARAPYKSEKGKRMAWRESVPPQTPR